MRYLENITVLDTMIEATNLSDTDDSPLWDSGATYSEGDVVALAATHLQYKSLVGSNLNKNPETEETYWVRQNYTNKWRAFDRFIADTAKKDDVVTYTIRPGVYIDTIVLYNISAVTVDIVITSDADGEIFNTSYSLLDNSRIIDWYSYYFTPITYSKDTLLVRNIPPYTDTEIQISINNSGSTAAVGQIDIGREVFLGHATQETAPFYDDFSIKERDEFGRWTVTERPISNGVRYQVEANTNTVESIRRQISARRATPTTFFVPDVEKMGTVVFGYPKEFEVPLRFGTVSFPLEIEGLT